MSKFVRNPGLSLRRQNGFLMFGLSNRESRSDSILIRLMCSHPGENYPEMEKLELPFNLRDCYNTGFSNQRSRDMSSARISSMAGESNIGYEVNGTLKICDSLSSHYSCRSPIDLSSCMQTNVPQPFQTKSKPTHLNMPNGQCRQEAKYISDQLHKSHHLNNTISPSLLNALLGSRAGPDRVHLNSFLHQSKCYFSSTVDVKNTEPGTASEAASVDGSQTQKLNNKQRLKNAVKMYGATVVVLHVSLSLCNLGICYLLVQSGVDFESILSKWDFTEGAKTAATVGPFVVAYAIHKATAPFRISLSLLLTPFVVNFLKKRGFLLKSKGKGV